MTALLLATVGRPEGKASIAPEKKKKSEKARQCWHTRHNTVTHGNNKT